MAERPLRSTFRARLASTISPVAMAAVSVLLVLVVFEVGLRLTQDRASEDASADPTAALFTPSQNDAIGFEHTADARVRFPEVTNDAGWNPEWHVSTDGQGLRRNGPGGGPPPEEIGICLGDSIMFGTGVNDNETIPALLSDFVSESVGRRFECLNFGVPNYTTAQEVERFRYKAALGRSPSIVVIEIYTNDFKTRLGRVKVLEGRTELVRPGAPFWLATRVSDLRLWTLSARAVLTVRDWMRRRGVYPKANAKPLEPAQIGAVYGALDELRAMLEPRGIPLLIVSFPRDWQLGAPDRTAASERQRVVREYCERHGIAYIDLLDDFYGQPIEAYFRPGDDSHPHLEATRSIANRIGAEVVRILRVGAGEASSRSST